MIILMIFGFLVFWTIAASFYFIYYVGYVGYAVDDKWWQKIVLAPLFVIIFFTDFFNRMRFKNR